MSGGKNSGRVPRPGAGRDGTSAPPRGTGGGPAAPGRSGRCRSDCSVTQPRSLNPTDSDSERGPSISGNVPRWSGPGPGAQSRGGRGSEVHDHAGGAGGGAAGPADAAGGAGGAGAACDGPPPAMLAASGAASTRCSELFRRACAWPSKSCSLMRNVIRPRN